MKKRIVNTVVLLGIYLLTIIQLVCYAQENVDSTIEGLTISMSERIEFEVQFMSHIEEYGHYNLLRTILHENSNESTLREYSDYMLTLIDKYWLSSEPGVISEPLFAYRLYKELKGEITSLMAQIPIDTLQIENFRADIAGLQIERIWGEKIPLIPRFDSSKAGVIFDQIKKFKSLMPILTYERNFLLIRMQKEAIGSLTDIEPYDILIDGYPELNNIREHITFDKLKVTAFMGRADCLYNAFIGGNITSEQKEAVYLAALLYQMVIDYFGSIPVEVKNSFNSVDTEYFQNLLDTAYKRLEIAKLKGIEMGIDVEGRLTKRVNVYSYRID